MASHQQASFTGGEISPNLYNRVDLQRWFSSLKTCRNFVTQPYGGAKNRSGTYFVTEAKTSTTRGRLVPFRVSATEGYVLEFGHLYVRVSKNGSALKLPTSAPAWVTARVYAVGDIVDSSGSGLFYCLKAHTSAGVSLIFDGGTSTWLPIGSAGEFIELVTPYTEAELHDLSFTQSVDVLTIAHPNHQNANLSRYYDFAWSLDLVPNESGPWMDLNLDTTITMGTNKVTGSLVVQSTGAIFDAVKHNGRLLYIEQRGYGKPWEVQKAITVGDIRRSDGKYYQAQNSATTGTLRPVHTKDTWYDGQDGVNWLYLHSGFGIVRIDSVTDPTHANATVLSRLPDELSSSGTGFGASVSMAGATYGDAGDGFLLITKTTHGITTTGPARATVTGGTVLSLNILAVTANTIKVDISFSDFYAYYSSLTSLEPPITGTLWSDRWKFGAWAGDQGWPSKVFYHQGRRGYAATIKQPNKVWLSRSNSYNDFSVSTPLIDTDALDVPLASSQLDSITGVLSMDRLIVLTAGGEWALGPSSNDPLTPGNAVPRPQGFRGASTVHPLGVGDTALFVQEKGTVVRDLDFDLSRDKYIGNDLTVFADHLLEGKSVYEWAFQQNPFGIVWMVRSDGALLGMTYMKEQQVLGWHRHDTGGDVVESVCCVGEPGEDVVYLMVKRTVDGAVKRYIERMKTRLVTDIKEAFFVDCGLSYDGRVKTNMIAAGDDYSATTMTITGGTNWDETEQLLVTSSTPFFVGATDVDDALVYTGLGDGLEHRLVIEQFLTTTTVKARPTQTLHPSLWGAARLDWQLARNTFTLAHLPMREVSVLSDGNSAGRFTTDSAGRFTMGSAGVRVHAGIPITADMETLSVTVQGQEPITNKKKSIPRVTAQVLESRGLKAGRDFNHLRAVKERNASDGFGVPSRLQDGLIEVAIDTTWSTDGSVCIRQDEPLPLTITALIPEVVVGSV